ncbi:DUF6702 family protein [Brevundimonas sp.]|uniref:DUF6702 family protein n=1 Tax=Brevundimonas sp. TaxID=1871086 RepID=UPI002D36F3AD|nr:DUF6702 family protein [Brevundimonas sp.]HYC73820.1 DUF6702 family protein [Brevundimonas sp.]
MRLTATLIVAALVGTAAPVAAHKGHGGLTVVQIDTANGQIHVAHRLAAHDVEPALPSIAPDAQPSLDDADAVRALEQHLGSHFEVSLDGEPVTLSRTDTHLAGDSIRVEFSGFTTDRQIGAVGVDLNFFPGVHEDQEILVNVRIDGVTRSARFRNGSSTQTLTF